MPFAASFGGNPVHVSSCGKGLRHQDQKDLGLNSGPDSFLCVTFFTIAMSFIFFHAIQYV